MSANSIPAVDEILKNPYVMATLKIAIVMYASILAPKIPQSAQAWLGNTYVKIAILAAILYIAERDFQLALILSVAFIVTVNMLSGRAALESFAAEYTKYKGDTSRLLEPKAVIYPGCQTMKLKDLLDAFGNDKLKLQESVRYAFHELLKVDKSKTEKERLEKAARYAGLPYNVELSDETAPFIATILLQYGFKLSKTCQAPQ